MAELPSGFAEAGKKAFHAAVISIHAERAVVDDVIKELPPTLLKLYAMKIGCKLISKIIDGVLHKGIGGEKEDKVVQDSRSNALQVILPCSTDERFLEVLDDFKTGRMRERLNTEFSFTEIKVEGLQVNIENIEEVEAKAAAINQRKSHLMAESSTSHGGRAVQNISREVALPDYCEAGGLLRIIIRDDRWPIGGLYAIYKQASKKQDINEAVTKAICGQKNHQEVCDIRPGSLCVLLLCSTHERFLEVLNDFKFGRMKKRLKMELLFIGIETDELMVEIANFREVKGREASIMSKMKKQNDQSQQGNATDLSMNRITKAYQKTDGEPCQGSLTDNEKAHCRPKSPEYWVTEVIGDLNYVETPTSSNGEYLTTHSLQNTERNTNEPEAGDKFKEGQSREYSSAYMMPSKSLYTGVIVKARSLALRFMAAHPFCVRAIPYKNDDETQRNFTMCLYVDNDGNEIPKKFEEDSQKVFAGYNIEYCDLQELARCKLATQLPVDKRSCTQELKDLTKTIEENLHIFENRLNVTAVQASYKIENNIEKDIPCVTVYVLGKGRIPVGETGVMAIKAFADYPFDVVEGYYQSCVRPEKSYVYTLHAGVGIGIKSSVLLGSEVGGDSVVGNGVDSRGKIKLKDNTCDGMGNGHETVGELTNKVEGDVGNGVESDGKIKNGHESFRVEGIECENFGELEEVVEDVGRLGITMQIKSDNGAGTLGGFLEDQNGTRYILSCQHVLCPDENDHKAGVIIQPAQCDYNDEVARAKEMIKFRTDQLSELNERRKMIEENNHVEIERNEEQKRNLEDDLNKNEKTVQNKPRVIGEYCDGLKQNVDFQSTDGSCKKIYVDAAFARLEPYEVSKIKSYNKMDPECCPVVGFETMVLKEKNIPFIPTGEIVDLETFSEQLEKTPEPNFWKIGRTTGVTYGTRETNLFQNDHAYKKEICAGDLSVVPASVFCCDCKELTHENQVDVSCIEWPVYCAICKKEIGKEPSPSWTSALWKYNCLTIKTPMKEFCEQGDSGALVFDDSGRAWGILSGQFCIPRKNVRIGLVVPLCVALKSLGRRSGKEFKLWCRN